MQQTPSSPRDALAEDSRRIGVAFIVAGIVAAFLRHESGPNTAVAVAFFGMALCIIGYAITAHNRSLQ